MIIESIVLGITLIIISPLILVDRILKREHDDKIKFEEKIKLEEAAEFESLQPDIVRSLRPFMKIEDDLKCPTCGEKTNLYYKYGLALPTVCSKADCKYKEVPHLHVKCHSCKAELVMKTRDGK